MAQNKQLSDLDLQKILESDEFFTDLIQFDEALTLTQERNSPVLSTNGTADATNVGTIESKDLTLEVIYVPDATESGQNKDVAEPKKSCQSPDGHIPFDTALSSNQDRNVSNLTATPVNDTSGETIASNEIFPTFVLEGGRFQDPTATHIAEKQTEKYEEEKDLRKRHKKMREKGCKDKTLTKNKDTEKYFYKEEKEERRLRPTCQSGLCKKVKNRFCNTFTLHDRKEIFSNFWKMSWDMRKVYVYRS